MPSDKSPKKDDFRELTHSVMKQYTIEQCFELGNYVEVVRRDEQDKWQTHAATGLIGMCAKGLEGMARFDCVELPFYRAVTHWLDGDEDQAATHLEKINNDHARNLVSLIRKPKIECLTQLSWHRGGCQDLLTGIQRDTKFRVRNISFHPHDLHNRPYADIHKYYDKNNPPDLYNAMMVEWHLIPPNIHELPCPTFGHTNDIDLHIQTIYPWLQMFDEFLASHELEWHHITQLTGGKPVTTFPKTFGVPDNLPPLPEGERQLDFYLSGSVINSYWPEKTGMLLDLLKEAKMDSYVVNGFLPFSIYFRFLGQSKTCFSTIHRPLDMPTRALDALSMGTAVAVHDESILNIYLDKACGLYPYHVKDRTMKQTILHMLENLDDVQKKAKRGAAIVRREFSLSQVASHYYRFLTFMAAKPRAKRNISPPKNLYQKRPVVKKGFVPAEEPTLLSLCQTTLRKMVPTLKSPQSAAVIIDATREIVMHVASLKDPKQFADENAGMFRSLFGFFRSGTTRFPNSLVLKFNYLRSLFHFNMPADKTKLVELASDILKKRSTEWELDLFDDVLSWDCFSDHFNYRKYFTTIVGNLFYERPYRDVMVNTILASVCHYAGMVTKNRDYIEQSCELDPDFDYYQLKLARLLSESNDTSDIERSLTMLEKLSNGSVVYQEAFALWEDLLREYQKPSERFQQISQENNHIANRIISMEPLSKKIKKLDLHQEVKTPNPPQKTISAIALDCEEKETLHLVLQMLAAQSIVKGMEILVCRRQKVKDLDDLARLNELKMKGIGIEVLEFPQNESTSNIYRQAMAVCKGQYVAFIHPEHFWGPQAFKLLALGLEQYSDAVITYADFGITTLSPNREIDTLGYVKRPDFKRRSLFGQQQVEPFFLVRKEFADKQVFPDASYGNAVLFGYLLRLSLFHQFVHIPSFQGNVPIESVLANPDLLSPGYSDDYRKAIKSVWPLGWGKLNIDKKKEPITIETLDTEISPKQFVTPSEEGEINWCKEWGLLDEREAYSARTHLRFAQKLLLEKNWLMAENVLKEFIPTFGPMQTPQIYLAIMYKHTGQYQKLREMIDKDEIHGSKILSRFVANLLQK